VRGRNRPRENLITLDLEQHTMVSLAANARERNPRLLLWAKGIRLPVDCTTGQDVELVSDDAIVAHPAMTSGFEARKARFPFRKRRFRTTLQFKRIGPSNL
jgi:hypothetical protein